LDAKSLFAYSLDLQIVNVGMWHWHQELTIAGHSMAGQIPIKSCQTERPFADNEASYTGAKAAPGTAVGSG
jgi:hypothetical protein